MADSLNQNTIEHIAQLAKLELTNDEKERFGKQFGQILDHMETMNAVDTSSVEPTAQVNGLTNIFREDIVGESFPQETVLELAPEHEGGYVKVKAVFGENDADH